MTEYGVYKDTMSEVPGELQLHTFTYLALNEAISYDAISIFMSYARRVFWELRRSNNFFEVTL